jgi:hypothetical protein
LKACIDDGKHKELLVSLDRNLDTLERLTSDSLELAPIRTEMKRKAKIQHVEHARQLVRSLHNSLKSRWQCSCQNVHVAHLLLSNTIPTDVQQLRFRLVVSYDALESIPATSTNRQMGELEIQTLQKS